MKKCENAFHVLASTDNDDAVVDAVTDDVSNAGSENLIIVRNPARRAGLDLYRTERPVQDRSHRSYERTRRYHKVKIAVPNDRTGRRPNLGRQAAHNNFVDGNVDGRVAAALERLFRSKSQKSRTVLEILQYELIGHIFDVPEIFQSAAQYCRTAYGYVMVVKKPSFRAVRLMIKSMTKSRKQTFRLPTCIRDVVPALAVS